MGLTAVADERGVIVTFSDTASNEDGLLIERRASTGEAWVELSRLGRDANQYADRDTENDRNYYYRVKAYRIVNDQWCESLPADSGATLTFPHPAADFHTGEVADNRDILLLWTDTNNLESGYVLERRVEGESTFVVAAELPADTTRFTDAGRTPGAIYEYRLLAVNSAGRSAPVSLSARASAAPQLSWIGEPWLEPNTCHLVSPGMATYDQVLGAVFASASATVGKSSTTAIATEGGVEATLDDLSLGPFTIEWSVLDSLGSRGSLVRNLSLDVHSSAQALAPPRPPRALLGEDHLEGRQAARPGCANCSGRRASISTAQSASCSLGADGTVSCWGYDYNGQLGSGGGGDFEVEFVEPCADATCTGPLRSVQTVAASAEHTCAILSNGEARCWSENGFRGELGNGEFVGGTGTPEPVCLSGRVSDGSCVRRTNFLTTGRQTISLGDEFSCAVVDAGRANAVTCWGSNADGVMGNGSSGSATNQPVALEVCASGSRATGNCVPLGDVLAVDVSTSEEFACVLLENGRVRCWGDNGYDYLGLGANALAFPYKLTTARYDVCETGSVATNNCVPMTDITALSVADYHSCVIGAGGRVRCWGYASGLNMGAAANVVSTAPNPVDLCASGTFSAATRTCSDANGDTGLTGALELGVAPGHGCVIVAPDREVHCWGTNGYGQLGDGTDIERTYPSVVCASGNVDDGSCVPLTGASRLDVRYRRACVDVGGTTYCWGEDLYGQMGHGNADDNEHHNPVPMCASGTRSTCVPLQGVTQLGLGESYSCVVTAPQGGGEQRIHCVGRNFETQLGRGDYSRRLTAGKVCASGSMWTCQPQQNVVAMASGDQHTCIIDEAGALRCFGYNGAGQLGLGVHDFQDDRRRPLPVCASGTFDGTRCADGAADTALTGVVGVAAGMHHTCAVLAGGALRCFGLNNCGQLGNGKAGVCNAPNPAYDGYVASDLENYELTSLPTELCGSGGDTQPCLPLEETVVSVSAGQLHTCALLEDSSALCFGRNDVGQLGSGEPTALHANPVPVCQSASGSGCPRLFGIVQLSLGNLHSCALLADGTARCWGENARGQLGDGTTTTPRINPVRVCRTGFGPTCDPLSNIVSITSGDHFNCALLVTGEVYCWGSNEARAGEGFVGTLGAGTSVTQTSLPLQVCAPTASPTCDPTPNCAGFLNDAVAISAGETHTCAQRADGSMACWGEEFTYGIGIGAISGTTDYCTPVRVCTDGVDTNCPTPLGEQAVATCDLLRVNVVGGE